MNEENKINPDPEEIRSIFDDMEEEEEILAEPEEVEEAPTAEEEVPAVEEEIPVEEIPTEESVCADAEIPVVENTAEEEIPVEEEIPAEEIFTEELPREDADPLHHSLLEDPQVGEEILADETALAGLARHGDAELEQIIQETMESPASQTDIPIQEYQHDADRKEEAESDEEEEMEEPLPKGRPK